MPDGSPTRAKQAAKPPLLTQRVAENAFHHTAAENPRIPTVIEDSQINLDTIAVLN
jgi:hypothetical protein